MTLRPSDKRASAAEQADTPAPDENEVEFTGEAAKEHVKNRPVLRLYGDEILPRLRNL